MLRADFENNLNLIQDEILELSSMVEHSILKSIQALKNRDVTSSQQVIDDDDLIDSKQAEIEEKCIQLIALQSPVAGDLRIIVSVMMIAIELERIGDYAEGIGKISVLMGDMPPLKPLIDIPRMAENATKMLRLSIDSFVKRDPHTALDVCDLDDEIDDTYNQVYRELLTYMMADPATIQRATYLLWVAHDLERSADRATNIAERVLFLVTGSSRRDDFRESLKS
ncbi:MAG: phosphate transport system regulatory protein PhoU [Chloroflexi bacterium]|nr:phosphate transport system regulatory protein PhoU [Chloroflexota bacterium]MBA13787.1 phosphate transport system regulatory protein PhoU [Chloroflexota bacterium]MBG55044.1 phosphate transport system regulatory protein PhoU [Chloroflexota bacterium]|tara:strand:+ start:114 stop:788 length:675 start_codon:yes stop_codon:yes gene_type:complete